MFTAKCDSNLFKTLNMPNLFAKEFVLQTDLELMIILFWSLEYEDYSNSEQHLKFETPQYYQIHSLTYHHTTINTFRTFNVVYNKIYIFPLIFWLHGQIGKIIYLRNNRA